MLALVRLEASELSSDDVFPLLADPSVLVRLWARKRWHELDGDAAQACRSLVTSTATPARRAYAYTGLAEADGPIERAEILSLIRGSHPTLQNVGLRLLMSAAEPGDVAELLDLVRSDHPTVARLAVDVLAANLGIWTLDQIGALRHDPSPDIRRRAWMLHRSRGGWESVIADLEIVRDPDEQTARLGRRPRVPMYLLPSSEQRVQIERLLAGAALDRGVTLDIAFAAGLDHVAASSSAEPPTPRTPRVVPPTAQQLDPWWRAVFRRRSGRS